MALFVTRTFASEQPPAMEHDAPAGITQPPSIDVDSHMAASGGRVLDLKASSISMQDLPRRLANAKICHSRCSAMRVQRGCGFATGASEDIRRYLDDIVSKLGRLFDEPLRGRAFGNGSACECREGEEERQALAEALARVPTTSDMNMWCREISHRELLPYTPNRWMPSIIPYQPFGVEGIHYRRQFKCAWGH